MINNDIMMTEMTSNYSSISTWKYVESHGIQGGPTSWRKIQGGSCLMYSQKEMETFESFSFSNFLSVCDVISPERYLQFQWNFVDKSSIIATFSASFWSHSDVGRGRVRKKAFFKFRKTFLILLSESFQIWSINKIGT